MLIKEVNTVVITTRDDKFVVSDLTYNEVKAWKAWADIVAKENKVRAIKRIRTELHTGLREAKRFVEESQEGFLGYDAYDPEATY